MDRTTGEKTLTRLELNDAATHFTDEPAMFLDDNALTSLPDAFQGAKVDLVAFGGNPVTELQNALFKGSSILTVNGVGSSLQHVGKEVFYLRPSYPEVRKLSLCLQLTSINVNMDVFTHVCVPGISNCNSPLVPYMYMYCKCIFRAGDKNVIF